ncbi:pyruvate kinase [Rubritalea tangerina]|uniref:Pyruvate kinase n=1 Tax=Rubritalea tangerina TaxID=430798 RepID=A0ABW4Z7Y9_9BACT
MFRKTSIISTLGPATFSYEAISDLIDAGVNVFRMNMSHAQHDKCRELVQWIREISENKNKHTAILFDLQGPSIRTGDLEAPYELNTGDKFEIRRQSADATIPFSTTVNYEGMMDDVEAGATLVVDNGTMLMRIEEKHDDRLICEVLTPGSIGNRRHINLPGTRLNLPALTEKDHKDLALAVECGADYIAGSFVRDAAHVVELRSEMEKLGGSADIVSKIEDQEAIKNIDDIILASDIIMIARGDLGIEVHVEELPIIQRRITKRCHALGRRVIVATHMLESMITNPTPTRAEVTDVSNAVFEEADAIMLSGETATGDYPTRCVETFDRIARRIEQSGSIGNGALAELETDKQKVILAATKLVDSLPNAELVVFTRRGVMAVQAALLRPNAPIHAFAPDAATCRRLALGRGIEPYTLPFSDAPIETINSAVDYLKENNSIKPGTPLVVLSDTLNKDKKLDSILVIYA